MKTSIKAIWLALCWFVPVYTVSATELSAHLGLVSLYKSRGVDQNNRNDAIRPALQGGVDVVFSSGLYVGNWNSSGKFGEHGNIEIDLYAGYRHEWKNGLHYDVGYIHYYYPEQGDLNSGEYYTALGYQGITFKALRGARKTVNHGDMYYTLSYQHALAQRWVARATLGYQSYHEYDLPSVVNLQLDVEYQLQKNLYLTATAAGANHRHEVQNGARDLRYIFGVRAEF